MIMGKNIDFDIDNSIVEKKVTYYTFCTFKREVGDKKRANFLAFICDVCDTLLDKKCGQKEVKNCTSHAFCG
jgi:hypothetical protein